MNHLVRELLAAGFGTVGLGLLVWGMWPAAQTTRVVMTDLHPLVNTWSGFDPGDVGAARGSSAQFKVELQYPQEIRVGDAAIVRLRLTPWNEDSRPLEADHSVAKSAPQPAPEASRRG